MTKDLWINLPVKDVQRSKTFFTEIGFKANSQFGDSADSAAITVGAKNIVVMLFKDTTFQNFIGSTPVADATKGTAVLFSFDAESREEVDETAKKVVAAGGTIYGQPADNQGWMYGFGFADPDGHRWNMLYMDMSKMPKP